MLPTDPKAAAQRSLHGRWPVGCQKVHVEWRFQSSDLGESRTATMARGRRTSGSPSVDGRRAVPTVSTELQDWKLAGMSCRRRDQHVINM